MLLSVATTGTIDRQLLSDQVYDLILASILDGTREPGSRVVESEIARDLGVSQAPVREAVKRLTHSGLLVAVPRSGSYVTQISPEERAVLRELRADLEAISARIAAKLISEETLLELHDITAAMHKANQASDWATFRALDTRFHRTVVAASNVPVLLHVWDVLEPTLLSQRVLGDPSFTEPQHLAGWHEELISALTSGDPVAAAKAFQEHSTRPSTSVLK